jgi:hypothetical protein
LMFSGLISFTKSEFRVTPSGVMRVAANHA